MVLLISKYEMICSLPAYHHWFFEKYKNIYCMSEINALIIDPYKSRFTVPAWLSSTYINPVISGISVPEISADKRTALPHCGSGEVRGIAVCCCKLLKI